MKPLRLLFGIFLALVITIGDWGSPDRSMGLEVTDIVAIEVTGANMIGMEVTAMFQDGSSETKDWEMIGAPGDLAGGVIGIDWFLTQAGDTFSGDLSGDVDLADPTSFNWRLSNSTGQNLTKLNVNGVPGNIVFDIINDLKVTEDSGFGTPFVPFGGDDPNIPPSYLQPVDGSPDLFGELQVDFTNGLGTGNSINFAIDTDLVEFLDEDNGGSGGNPPTTQNPIPEPGTLLLLGTGLIGLFSLKRIRSFNLPR